MKNNQEQLEEMLVEQARKVLNLTSEPELDTELKKIQSLVNIYDTIKQIEKLI